MCVREMSHLGDSFCLMEISEFKQKGALLMRKNGPAIFRSFSQMIRPLI